MDEEGNHEPEQAQEWSHSANNGSPSAAHSAAYPASSNKIQNYRQDAGQDEAHNAKVKIVMKTEKPAIKGFYNPNAAKNASRSTLSY